LETLQQEERPEEQLIEGQPPEAPPPEQEQVNWKRFALDIIETLLLAVVLFLGINAVSARVRVDGSSMHPTLENGEFVLVSKLNYKLGEVERGDIIVFHYPMNPSQELIKRVIGLPGDHVAVKDGLVFVNGQRLEEPYIAAAPTYIGDWDVPEEQLFVLGDNRNDSSDSHQWRFLPIANVVGKAVMIYWPPAMWNVIQHEPLLVPQ
jgi:signal peptidase I